MTFSPDSGRFEARVRPGTTLTMDKVATLIATQGTTRGEHYEVRWGEPQERPSASWATRAESFELVTLAGDHYDLDSVVGQRPIVLVFWASWCAPCLTEAPHLVRLHSRHAPRVEFVSVSIDVAGDHDKLRQVAADLKLPYPVLLDPKGEVLAKYASGAGIPLTLVIHRDGTIAYHHENYAEGDEVELGAAIERAVLDPPRGEAPDRTAAGPDPR